MSWTLSQSTETCCVLESFCSTQTPPLVFTPVSIKCRQRKPWRKETNWSDDSSRQCDSTRIPEWRTPWKSIVVLMTHDDTKQTPIRREPESGTAAVQTNLENLKRCFELTAKKKEEKRKNGIIGSAPGMRDVLQMIEMNHSTPVPVMLSFSLLEHRKKSIIR